jgi:hypothetical protein
MPNLFSALSCVNQESLAMQLALLENVSTSNALMPKLKGGLNKSVAVVDAIGKLFGSKATIRVGADATDLKTKVQESYSRHKARSSERLLSEIRDCCVSRTGLQQTCSDTLLSVRIIEEAAAFYDVGEWLTPAEKVEAISRRHQEESLASLRKMVAKMSTQERADLERTVTEELERLPHDQREAVLRDLRLDSLSGEAVMKILLAAGGPLASMTALSAAGFGAYVALTTIIHAVATTVLGITLPFALYTTATSVLSSLTGPVGWLLGGAAIFVTWRFSERKLSRSLFAGLITAAAENLPTPSTFVVPSSPLSGADIDRAAETAKAMAMTAVAGEATTETSRRDLARITEQFKRAEVAKAKAQQTISETSKRLSSSSVGLDEVRRLEAELKEKELARLEMTRRAEEYQRKFVVASAELNRLEREASQKKGAQTSFEDGEAKRILDFWSIHFPRISFDRQPIRWVVHKRHKDRLSLERKLIELNQSEDPAALSLGKMRTSGEHHLRFKLVQVECRMFYRVSGLRIQIVELGTNQETH